MQRYEEVIIKLGNLQKELDELNRLAQEVSGSLEYNDRREKVKQLIRDTKGEIVMLALFEEEL